jgi:uncharacterized protein YqeY
MIADTITKKIAEALKAHNEIRLSTLRMLSSALNYEFIAKQHKLTDEEEIAVVKKEARKREDAMESLRDAKGKLTGHTEEEIDERINKEKEELSILKEYLPPEMPDKELEELVNQAISETGAKTLSEMGRVIGAVMQKAKGGADGKKVAEKVKEALAMEH